MRLCVGKIMTVEDDLTFVGSVEPSDCVDERSFTSSIRSDNAY
jgi:hypothetical protein